MLGAMSITSLQSRIITRGFKMVKWISARAGEHSTWVGIAGLFALVGYQIEPDALTRIAQLAGLIASGGLIVAKDK